jgi:uncharacterized integral membrane protein (TIGR00697 family)
LNHKLNIFENKATRLFIILGGFFITNALLAEFIGVKIFSLEKSLGIPLISHQILDHSLNFNLTTGVVLWPVVFIMTDLINEYYGQKGVRLLSNIAVVFILFSFLMVYLAINLVPADWWVNSAENQGVPDYQKAFEVVFGQGLWIIIGSLVAFLVGQITDVYVFQKIKSYTGDKKLWLRATGSTLVSQFIDSFVVLIIAFKFGAGWSWSLVIAIGINNYIYKFIMAVVLTPLIYLGHFFIEKYLGHELATELKNESLLSNN